MDVTKVTVVNCFGARGVVYSGRGNLTKWQKQWIMLAIDVSEKCLVPCTKLSEADYFRRGPQLMREKDE